MGASRPCCTRTDQRRRIRVHSELGDLLLWLEKRQGEDLLRVGADEPLPEARDQRLEIDEHDVAAKPEQRVASASSEGLDDALVARLRVLRSESALRAEVGEERSETSHSMLRSSFADWIVRASSMYLFVACEPFF